MMTKKSKKILPHASIWCYKEKDGGQGLTTHWRRCGVGIHKRISRTNGSTRILGLDKGEGTTRNCWGGKNLCIMQNQAGCERLASGVQDSREPSKGPWWGQRAKFQWGSSPRQSPWKRYGFSISLGEKLSLKTENTNMITYNPLLAQRQSQLGVQGANPPKLSWTSQNRKVNANWFIQTGYTLVFVTSAEWGKRGSI